MSYSRQFSRNVTVYYSGSVSYPASEHGGRVSYSGTATETVYVNVDVDTDAFDDSCDSCKGHIDALTTSVAATEAAQVASIRENSRTVADTIVQGFFKTVRSGLSTQILELSQAIEAKLMHLKAQSQELLAKRKQMESDYHRKRSQYTKLFNDLDKELENRVKALDQPAFKMAEQTQAETDRMLTNDALGIAAMAAAENAELNAQLSAATIRSRGNQAMQQAIEFLSVQKYADRAILQSTISGISAADATFYLPVCYYESVMPGGATTRECSYDENRLPASIVQQVQNEIFAAKRANDTDHLPSDERQQLEDYFSEYLNNDFATRHTEHDSRVRATISKMFFSK